MATAKGSGFWGKCASPQCDKAAQGGRGFSSALDEGCGLCGPCHKAAGHPKRTTSDLAFAGTDKAPQRASLTEGEQLPKVQAGSHKALWTQGGRLKGGTPDKVAQAVQALLPKAPKVQAPKVQAPKAAPKRQRKRPAAKSA